MDEDANLLPQSRLTRIGLHSLMFRRATPKIPTLSAKLKPPIS
jgi:hypothetical protein